MRNVYLVGFMGAGKTSVGRELARLLAVPFLDLDAEIERAEGLAIRNIFERLGEPRFREIEHAALERISASPTPAVVALGGGAYASAENRAIVDASGTAVWLKVSFANVVSRVTMGASRPLFQDREKAQRLYDDRLPFYRLAPLHVSADGRLPEAIALDIARQLDAPLDAPRL